MYMSISHYLSIFPQENYTKDAIHHAQLGKTKWSFPCQIILGKYKSTKQKIQSWTSKSCTFVKQFHPDLLQAFVSWHILHENSRKIGFILKSVEGFVGLCAYAWDPAREKNANRQLILSLNKCFSICWKSMYYHKVNNLQKALEIFREKDVFWWVGKRNLCILSECIQPWRMTFHTI